tara:strand:- start:181 stop:354 length:174 start_codon:yes stop_codon:yes gene_type:complete
LAAARTQPSELFERYAGSFCTKSDGERRLYDWLKNRVARLHALWSFGAVFELKDRKP